MMHGQKNIKLHLT